MSKIEVVNLNKLFNNNNGIKNVNFTLSEGKVLGLLGNNGAGKTTTLKYK